MVRSKHDRVGRRTVRAERGQRAARGPDGVELVNLNCLFSPACFLHHFTFAGRPLPSLPTLRVDPIIGGLLEVVLREASLQLANRADVSSGSSEKSFGFS
jgi:hypothetical protein